MNQPLYPWLHTELARFASLRAQGRMPHALLLTGEVGVGKSQLAMRLAQTALCHQPAENGLACGQCASCRPFLAGAHPDFSLLQPLNAGQDSEPDKAGDGAQSKSKAKDSKSKENKGKEKDIKVDAVRDFCSGLYLSSSLQRGKVGLVQPAEAMNASAANSLLKTLEEPPAGTLIILVTAQPARLPLTIRSRCQRWTVEIPERATALEWLSHQTQVKGENPALLLDLAEGRPLAALALAEPECLAQRSRWIESLLHLLRAGGNPLALAGTLDKADLPELVHWSRLILSDLTRLCVAAHTPGTSHEQFSVELVNHDFADVLLPLAARLDARALFSLYDYLAEAGRLLNHPLNRDLIIEELLIRFQRLGGQS
jgi:DNA polymerase-3 subunit delta'